MLGKNETAFTLEILQCFLFIFKVYIQCHINGDRTSHLSNIIYYQVGAVGSGLIIAFALRTVSKFL